MIGLTVILFNPNRQSESFSADFIEILSLLAIQVCPGLVAFYRTHKSNHKFALSSFSFDDLTNCTSGE